MEILFLLLGLAVGVAVGLLLQRGKRARMEGLLALAEQKSEQQETLTRQQAERQDALASELRGKLAVAEQACEQLRQQVTETRVALEGAQTELRTEREHTAREARLRQEQQQKELELRQQQLDEQLNTIREQFATLASKVLQQTSDRLKSTNTESMESITKPLRDNLKQLQEAIRATNTETAKSTESLTVQLKAMSEQTTKIDRAAATLTNVIKGGNGAQGKWGERMLTEILDAQGYQVGVDYDVQQTLTDAHGNVVLNDESGQRMRPDIILHYPNNEDVVVDSKMTIEAYYQYMNTDDESLRRKYADDLARSVRRQMDGLAKKDYSHYILPPRRAIDFVIMFVPNDGALQLALSHDPALWRDAFDRHVFITGQQNLMAILKIIQIAWRQYAQTESQKKVFGLADELLKRVGDFIARFDKIGKSLDAMHRDYEDAYNKVHTGRQSIVQKANELKSLGAKENAKYPIPETEAALPEETEVAQ